jgi:glutamate formiminotransferase
VPEERPLLLAVPNVSEGRDADAIEAIAAAFTPARLLDVHSDPDHGRSVFTLAARQGELARALLAGARAAAASIDLTRHTGVHPHVGAIDVAPVVYLDETARGAATAEALTAAALIGERLDIPVILYGELATAPDRRERADLRAGGPERLAGRVASGQLAPDYGPARVDQRVGAVLVTARPPLVAFNVDLQTDDVDLARRLATELREAGGGPRGVRAIGLLLPERGRAQVSLNVHDHRTAPLAELVERVASRAAIAELELVGLAPAAALDGLPGDIPLRGFDPERHVIENALRSSEV